MALRFDGSRLAKATRTPQGFVRVDARLTRTGVFKYTRADGSTVRELRHPGDVFAVASLATADAGLPVTVGHRGSITPANVREFKVGQTRRDAAAEGGRFVGTQLQIEDADAIARVDSGELVELSAGYEVDIITESGTYQGEPYDARQTNIRFNHVALLPRGGGRAGSEVGLRLDSGDAVLADTDDTAYTSLMTVKKIRLDGVEIDVPAPAADRISALEKSLAEAQTAQGKAEAAAQAAAVRADAAEKPAVIDAKVAERVALIDSARKVLGVEFKCDGLSTRQIHEAVLVKSGYVCEGRADAVVSGAFEFAVSQPASAARVVAVVVPPTPGAVKTDAKDAPIDMSKVRAEAAAAKSKPWTVSK